MMGRKFQMLSPADDIRQIQCPKCGALPGKPCPTEDGRCHVERCEAYFAGVLEPMVKFQAELKKPVESEKLPQRKSLLGGGGK